MKTYESAIFSDYFGQKSPLPVQIKMLGTQKKIVAEFIHESHSLPLLIRYSRMLLQIILKQYVVIVYYIVGVNSQANNSMYACRKGAVADTVYAKANSKANNSMYTCRKEAVADTVYAKASILLCKRKTATFMKTSSTSITILL